MRGNSRFLTLVFIVTAFFCATLPARAQFVQQGQKLISGDAEGQQGSSVALSADGNTAIVGAPVDSDDSGAAWIFTRSGGVWGSTPTKLVASDNIGKAWQGSSVALSADGNTAIVGGPGDNTFAGAAWIFTNNGGTWSEQAKLVGSVTNQTVAALQGWSVALSSDGNTALIGAPTDNSSDACPSGSGPCSGAAWVFTRNGSSWKQQQKLFGTGAVGLPQQGFSVALSGDGNTAMIGGWADNNGTAGAAWVFTQSGGVWTQQGNKLVGTGGNGNSGQGWSVAMSNSGNTALVGGPEDTGGTGAAWIFGASGGSWAQQAELVGTGAVGGANQGWSVALSGDGNSAIVGGWNDNGAIGAAWVFTNNGGVWNQQGQKLTGSGAAGASQQGSAVALSSDGSTAVVGGPTDNNETGAAWAYFQSTSSTTLTSSVNPSSVGQSVTFTATVSATAGTPTGTVTFVDGTTPLGTGSLSGGTATFSIASLSAGNHSITAVYSGDNNFSGSTSSVLTQVVNQLFTLSVAESGSGTVTSSPSGINCGATCSASFAAGTPVTLAATPASGGSFTGWSGACGGSGGCIVTMNAAQSVTATFSQIAYALSVSVSGNGTVTSSPPGISCPGTCSQSFVNATSVTLAATPASGWMFGGWGGACSGGGSCVVGMTQPLSVTASFLSTTTFTISVSASPANGGAAIGAGTFPAGSVQTVTATPATGHTFANWTENGGVVSTSPNYAFTLSANRSLLANFPACAAACPSALVAAVLPASRSVPVNGTATAFATIINTGTAVAQGCSIAPAISLPATFIYQTTNPSTNAVTGTANTPVNVNGNNGSQSFVFALTPSAAIVPTQIPFNFSCASVAPASIVKGLDTLLLSASTTPTPDVIALAATARNDGIVHVTNGSPPASAFAVATDNLGSSDTIIVATNIGAATLPITVTVCQTNPTTGVCLQAPASTVAVTINTNATPTFGIFVSATGTVPFDPANNRIFVTFTDSTSAIRGETSVAVETQ